MSRVLAGLEQFLAAAGFDRAPWLAVAFAAGIAAWFALDGPREWIMLIAALLATMAVATRLAAYPYLRLALVALTTMTVLGLGVVWTKSALVGAVPIEGPRVAEVTGTVLARDEQPARQRTRLILAIRDPETRRPMRVRVNVADALGPVGARSGDIVRVRARLMPPAPPMLPGGYNFARTAWFEGLAATGSALAMPERLSTNGTGAAADTAQARLSAHVRSQLSGSPGAIAATLASGDRGALPEPDAQAMRDSGLAHLLSISGLHVSAVVGAAYLVVLRLLALWPWLALRTRLPVVAAGAGALAGIGYTVLTGAEVPTVRSCIGALLVLLALAIGREALSLRMLAVAAIAVLLVWPESLVGPSFQMSFAAVLAIVTLGSSHWVRTFLGPREEGMAARAARYLAMLFLTGIVIELTLMPIALQHFHRAGVYGALANVVAIPLTTLVAMPLIAIALVLDSVGAGGPVWWLAGHALNVLLGLARFVSAQPGAVSAFPTIGSGRFALFLCGGLWIALWSGRLRWLGLLPVTVGASSLMHLAPPDILVSGDGRHVGLTGLGGNGLVVLRETRSDYVRDNLLEVAGMRGETRSLESLEGARCSPEFCTLRLRRGGRTWILLMARGRDRVPERELAAACERSDIVIADRWLPRSCRPRWLRADRRTLDQTGGLTIDLTARSVRTVAEEEGHHGWWRPHGNADAVPLPKKAQ